jgi:type IV pilus assembly protein PilB
MKGRGCDRCGGTGYKGRVGLFEIMEISESLRERILHNRPVTELRDLAVEEGMSTLRQSGLAKVREGVTTLEEVVRETM